MALTLSMGACAYRQEKGDAAPALSQSNGPSYASVRDQVLVPKCVSCHQEFTDYAKTFAEREDIRQKALVDHSMPKGASLSSDQTALLQKWLDAGAPQQSAQGATDTGTTTPPPPQALAPTWDNVQKHFFVPYCARCHGSPDDSEGDLELTDLAQVRAHASSILKHVLVDQNMPPSKRSYDRMEANDKLLMVNWISARMPGPDGSIYEPAPAPSPTHAPSPAPSPAPQPTP